jgi:DegV family protein with EDD domain
LDGILGVLEDVRKRVRVVAMLDTLEYVRRGGRVSWARARLGELLRIKPFIEVRNGLVMSLGQARTRHKGVQRLVELVLNLGSLERLAVLHTNAQDEAAAFLDALSLNLPTPPLTVNITTVVGTHAGPNGLGFAAVVR